MPHSWAASAKRRSRCWIDDRLVLSFGRTDEEYVDLLLKYIDNYSGVTLPQTKRDALVEGLRAGAETRPTVFLKVADDEQFKAALFDQVFVLMQYYGYLRREPDFNGLWFLAEQTEPIQWQLYRR